ncbi:MAG TPA: RNA degradosome polyphosphate kinase [Candidatus Fimivicinus intestinavium]|nr:RNA degradosome polyphosphate kinase [Candidatus Fimivicinus intestinavium]
MGEKKQKRPHIPYTNRELSWLSFNERVLEEAYEKENPLLERLKFLSITASNLDEFFMVRVAGLREQARLGVKKPYPLGQSPSAQLRQISEQAHFLCKKQYNCLRHSLLPMLRHHEIFIVRFEELDTKQKKFVARYFERTVFPVLTPLAIDQSRPFPLLANRSLNLAVRLKKEKETHFAVVQVPSILPRFIALPGEKQQCFILLEEVMIAYLPKLLETHEVKSVSLFRITRNADLSIDEEAEDLLQEIQKSIKKRKRGRPVRLEINAKCDAETRRFLIETLDVREADVYPCAGPLDLTAWAKLAALVKGHEGLRLKPVAPARPADFLSCGEDIFAAIRERDRFVHHPYESFDYVVKFLADAAEDPNVLAIKQTLYRVSFNSPIVRALMRAAENGKQVTVLVELKARFDEENNINWAKKLEQAGCHVIYGLVGLKTHCKILLVVRQDADGIRRYLHLGTGNYNDTTARLYTDMGLFTCREAYGSDASLLFNLLTGYSRPPQYQKFITAPDDMRAFFYQRIERETQNALDGKQAGIVMKVNSLLDYDMIERLYKASQAGVPIELIVRGICSLVPGVEGVSDHITVRSIVGRFLEHSRIFRFENAGDPLLYLGSADLMPRNLDRRVELVFPVEEPKIRARVEAVLAMQLKDTVNARLQGPDAVYRLQERRGKHNVDSQAALLKLAHEREKQSLAQQEESERFIPRLRAEELVQNDKGKEAEK